jgi:hypothetical protein
MGAVERWDLHRRHRERRRRLLQQGRERHRSSMRHHRTSANCSRRPSIKPDVRYNQTCGHDDEAWRRSYSQCSCCSQLGPYSTLNLWPEKGPITYRCSPVIRQTSYFLPTYLYLKAVLPYSPSSKKTELVLHTFVTNDSTLTLHAAVVNHVYHHLNDA